MKIKELPKTNFRKSEVIREIITKEDGLLRENKRIINPLHLQLEKYKRNKGDGISVCSKKG